MFLKRYFALVAALVFAGAALAQPANAPRKNFNIPAGNAATTLKTFSEQSGEQIVYPVDRVNDVETKAVSGELTARAALDRMLAGTRLAVVQDERTGAFAIRPSAPPANASNAASDRAAAAAVATGTAQSGANGASAGTTSNGLVVLSPFEVSTDSNRGYYSSSSLSGTRLNSNLSDLASSITVVTKEQLLDTAAVDINDVFLYEANTEGLHQYTEFTQDRDFFNDTTTLNPQSSNRVRGLTAANTARGNYATSSLLPIDTYNVESIEISRGPNTNIFGLGDASGTVNVNPLRANLTRDISQFTLRGDSYGGWRSSFDLNRQLAKNVLAIRLSALHEEKGFIRKPASETTNGFTGALTFRPLKKTTLRARFESHHNFANRANTTLMRDGYTEWRDNGMPVWNPRFGTTGGWRFLNGTAYTAVTAANEGTQFPKGLFPSATFQGVPSAYVVDGVLERYEASRANNNLTSPGTGAEFRYIETGTVFRRKGAVFGIPPLTLYQPPAIADKTVYDWTDINYLAPNYNKTKGETLNLELEQFLVQTQRHLLAFQFGFLREAVDKFDHAFFSRSDSGTPFVQVDVNEFFIDGTANPYFLRPYIGANQPRISWNSEENSNYRGTLAYQIDLREEGSWLRWLGRHSFNGYSEFRRSVIKSMSGGDRNISDYAWTSVNDRNSLAVRGNTYRLNPRYYIGGRVTDPGQIVEIAPKGIEKLNEPRPFIWYGTSTTGGVTSVTRFAEQAQLEGMITGGNGRKTEIRTEGGVWQGFFWNDRIIPTMGWRRDRQREIASRNLNANPPPNATSTIDPASRQNDLSYLEVYPGPWVENSGRTKTAGVVVKPFKWLALTYNKSDSFKPEAVRYDIHLKQSPNPTGSGKDYGVVLKLLRDDRLELRVNRYETVQKNSRSGPTGGAFAARTFRFFFDADTNLSFNSTTGLFDSSDDPWDLEQQGAQWYLSSNPSATPDQAIAAGRELYLKPFGFDAAYVARVREIGLGGFAEINTLTSKGVEVELAYNPSRNWTLKFTGAKQQTIDTELSQNINNFFAKNLAALEAIVIPTNPYTLANSTAGRQWWTSGATNPTSTATPQAFYFANILTTLKQASANAGKPRTQTREYRAAVTSTYQLAGLTDNRFLKNLSLGGSFRWESRARLGYYGAAPIFNGAVVEYDPTRPIYDKGRSYVEFWTTYRMKLFNDRVGARIQLNVKNPFENGRIQPFVYNPDGVPWNYRIVDPRQFILTATFDL